MTTFIVTLRINFPVENIWRSGQAKIADKKNDSVAHLEGYRPLKKGYRTGYEPLKWATDSLFHRFFSNRGIKYTYVR